MKTLNAILLILIICTSHAMAQQAFTSVALTQAGGNTRINFSVPKEANVVRYRIEAGNDGADFQYIGAVKSAGNSVFAKDYTFEAFGASYKYYRVVMEQMGAPLRYSAIIMARRANTPAIEPANVVSCQAMASH